MNPDGQKHPIVYVRIRQRRNVATVLRGQTWFWRAKSGDNNSPGPRSRGYFTNKQDCIDNVNLYFGVGTTVYAQETEHGNDPVRWGQSV